MLTAESRRKFLDSQNSQRVLAAVGSRRVLDAQKSQKSLAAGTAGRSSRSVNPPASPLRSPVKAITNGAPSEEAELSKDGEQVQVVDELGQEVAPFDPYAAAEAEAAAMAAGKLILVVPPTAKAIASAARLRIPVKPPKRHPSETLTFPIPPPPAEDGVSYQAQLGYFSRNRATAGPNAVNGPFQVTAVIPKSDGTLLRRPITKPSAPNTELSAQIAANLEQHDDFPSDVDSKVQEQFRKAVATGRLTLPMLELKQIPPLAMNSVVMQLRCLTAIYFADNRLTTLSKREMYMLRDCIELNFRNNRLSSLPEELSALTRLKVLDISLNQLGRLPVALSYMPSLTHLCCEWNAIKSFVQPFAIPTLETLEAAHNQIEFLPDGLQNCTRLRKLDLSYNTLPSLAILPYKKIAAEEDMRDPYRRPWEWEPRRNPLTGDLLFYHPGTKTASRVDPRVACKTLVEQEQRALEHASRSAGGISAFVGQDRLEIATKTGRSGSATSTANSSRRLKLNLKGVSKGGAPSSRRADPNYHDSDDDEAEGGAGAGDAEEDRKPPPFLPGVEAWPELQEPSEDVPGVSVERFQALVLRELYKQGRGEWQVLQNPDTGDLVFRNNVTMEERPTPPDGVDLFGNMISLETLMLSNNKLVAIPASMCSMLALRTLDLDHNCLISTSFPAEFRNLRLIKLSLRYNRLDDIPEPVCNVSTLQVLSLCANQLTRVPDYIGRLVSLQSLWMTENNITELPMGLSGCSKLQELRMGLNPLNEHWSKLLIKGAAHVLWQCRAMVHASQKGPPPKMEYARMGLRREATVALAEAQLWHEATVDRARESKRLQFDWKDLKSLPADTYQLTDLKELRLTGNDVKIVPKLVKQLTALKTIQWNQNRTRIIEDSAFEGLSLEVVRFEVNKLTQVPSSLIAIESLRYLSLSNNRIAELPASFGMRLLGLQSLLLDNNRLKALPATVGCLTSLEMLQLSRNRLSSLPTTMSNLVSLTDLRINSNELTEIPRSFCNLRFKHLNLSGNRIGIVPKYFTVSNFRNTLETLMLQSNHIVEVHTDIRYFSALQDLRLDSNPIKSPPPEVTISWPDIKDYCHLRRSRIRDLLKSAGFEQFIIDPAKLFPTCNRAIVGGIGYLSNETLAEMDELMDQFVNGKCYQMDTDGKELIGRFVKMRTEAAEEARDVIIVKLLRTLVACHKYNWADQLNYSNRVERPWGPENSRVKCFAVTGEAMFGNNGGRGSILSKADGMAHMLFAGLPGPDLSALATIDTLRNYKTAFGLIGSPADIVDFGDPAIQEPADTTKVKALKENGEEDDDDAEDDEEDEEAPPPLDMFRPDATKLCMVVQRIIWTDDDRAGYYKETRMMSQIERDETERMKLLFVTREGRRLVRKVSKELQGEILTKIREAVPEFEDSKDFVRRSSKQLVELVRERYGRYAQAAREHEEDEVLLADLAPINEQIIEQLQVLSDAIGDYHVAKQAVEDLAEGKEELKVSNWKRRRLHAQEEAIRRAIQKAQKRYLELERVKFANLRHNRPWDGVDGDSFEEWKVNAHTVMDEESGHPLYLPRDESEDSSDSDEEPLIKLPTWLPVPRGLLRR